MAKSNPGNTLEAAEHSQAVGRCTRHQGRPSGINVELKSSLFVRVKIYVIKQLNFHIYFWRSCEDSQGSATGWKAPLSGF